MILFQFKMLNRVCPQSLLVRHAGFDPASRRRPDEPRIGSGAGFGNHLKDWAPVCTGNPAFRLEFTPLQNGAGMTIFFKPLVYKQTLINPVGTTRAPKSIFCRS